MQTSTFRSVTSCQQSLNYFRSVSLKTSHGFTIRQPLRLDAPLLWFILATGGLVSVGFSPLQAESSTGVLVLDAGLILLCGIQHSIMNRSGFKHWQTSYIPTAAERCSFSLASGVPLLMVIAIWQYGLDGRKQCGSASVVGPIRSRLELSVLSHFRYPLFRTVGVTSGLAVFLQPARQAVAVRAEIYVTLQPSLNHARSVGRYLAVPFMPAPQFDLACLFSLCVAVGFYLRTNRYD